MTLLEAKQILINQGYEIIQAKRHHTDYICETKKGVAQEDQQDQCDALNLVLQAFAVSGDDNCLSDV